MDDFAAQFTAVMDACVAAILREPGDPLANLRAAGFTATADELEHLKVNTQPV